MISDLVAIGHGLLPTRQAFFHTARLNEKRNLYALFLEQGQPVIHLGEAGIIEAEANRSFFSIRPTKRFQFFSFRRRGSLPGYLGAHEDRTADSDGNHRT